MITTPDVLAAGPEIFLALVGMVLMMIGVFSPEKRALGVVSGLTVASFVAVLAYYVFVASGERSVAFAGLFVTDSFAVFMKVLVLLGAVLVLLMGDSFVRREGMGRFEFPILIVYATVGMMMMISANDLISLYMGLELQSLSLYVIAAIQRDRVRSSEAGLKYFVLGALSSGLLLYGCSMIYGFAGTTQFEVLSGRGAHAGDCLFCRCSENRCDCAVPASYAGAFRWFDRRMASGHHPDLRCIYGARCLCRNRTAKHQTIDGL